MRGGMSVISNRYARANNPYLKPEDYTSLPNVYICYLDVNNLYSWAMSQNLPVDESRFLSQEDISKIDFTSIPDDSEIGYVVECDLEYLVELHQSHNNFPRAPEHVIVKEENLSRF